MHAGGTAPVCSVDADAVWVIPSAAGCEVLSDYELGMALGQGSFGVTRLATERRTASLSACKSICKASLARWPTLLEDMRREVAALRALAGHQGVVQLQGVYEDRRALHLVMELCMGGDLLQHVARAPGGRLAEAEAAGVMRSVLAALAHCHAHGIMHRDVKPENFLVAQPLPAAGAPPGGAAPSAASPTIKIADFGVSARFVPGQQLSEVVGTPYYIAPEVLGRCYGPEADVWSAGVVAYLLLTGRLPFTGASTQQVLEAVASGQPDWSDAAWTGVSDAARNAVRSLLERCPSRRPSAQHALTCEWLRAGGGCCADSRCTRSSLECSSKDGASSGCSRPAQLHGSSCSFSSSDSSGAEVLVGTCTCAPAQQLPSPPAAYCVPLQLQCTPASQMAVLQPQRPHCVAA